MSGHAPLALLASLLLAAGCGDGESASKAPSGPPSAVPVRVLEVAPRALERAVEATGAVEAEHTVRLQPETTGQVVEVAFRDGQRVEKGQLLVRLRDGDARAAVDDAKARVDLAALELARAKELRARENVSQADLDRAVAEHALAAAALDAAQEALRRTRVVAPFAGTLGRREVSPGAVVSPTTVLTGLEALDRLLVDVALPEDALARVAPDQVATVSVSALPGETFPGVVTYVAPRVREDTRTVDVRVELDNPGGRLRPGMSAAVRIVTETAPEALTVPTEALVNSARGPSVYVVGEDGAAALRPVRTGDREAGAVEVVEGLAAGDRVVVQGFARLRPGAKVKIQGEGEASSNGAAAAGAPGGGPAAGATGEKR